MTPHCFGEVGMTSSAEARYRAISAEAPMVLVRKRCACNAVTSAKQLVQYGECPTCVKVHRIIKLAEEREMRTLRLNTSINARPSHESVEPTMSNLIQFDNSNKSVGKAGQTVNGIGWEIQEHALPKGWAAISDAHKSFNEARAAMLRMEPATDGSERRVYERLVPNQKVA